MKMIRVAIGAALCVALSLADPCMPTLSDPPNGDRVFNLTRLVKPNAAPYTLDSGSRYSFNVCGHSISCGASSLTTPYAACKQDHMTASFTGQGNAQSMRIVRLSQADVKLINSHVTTGLPPFPATAEGVKMVFAGFTAGDQVTVMIPCDPSATAAPVPVAFGAVNFPVVPVAPSFEKVGYLFVLPSPAGCPLTEKELGIDAGDASADDLSSGTLLLIAFMCVFVVYCLGGMIYKHQKYGVTGQESVPNIEFWQDVPMLIADGCTFTHNTLRGVLSGEDAEYAAARPGGSSHGYPAPPPSSGAANYLPASTVDAKNDFAVNSYNDL